MPERDPDFLIPLGKVDELIGSVGRKSIRNRLISGLNEIADEYGEFAKAPPESIALVHTVLDTLGLRYTDLDPLVQRDLVHRLSNFGDEVIIRAPEHEQPIDLIETQQNTTSYPLEY